MQEPKNSFASYFQEIKENCPALKNVSIHSFNDFNKATTSIPLEKRNNVIKLCVQQEQRIYNSIHTTKQFNLLQEIGNVNPQLQKELKETRLNDLPIKLEHYQRIKNDCESESYSQEFTKECENESHCRPFVTLRNLMDEYENEFSDLYINKYFDLN